MKKKLKKYGNTLVAVFTKEDQELYGLAEGDIIDIDDMFVCERSSNKKGSEKKEVKKKSLSSSS